MGNRFKRQKTNKMQKLLVTALITLLA